MSLRILLSCGEASGDLYAGALTRALRELAPDVEVSGLGGPQFAAAGGRIIVDHRGLSVTGFTEVVGRLSQLRAARRQLLDAARRESPQALVVIDYFGFNVHLARDARKLGIPVVYYVSPQIWAWRGGRIKDIRAVTDLMLVIFPFEEAIYREAGIPVQFVGHPLVDLAGAQEPREAFLRRVGADANPAAPVVALLPGSRTREVTRILPTLVDATALIRAAVPRVQFLLARASHLPGSLFDCVAGVPQLTVVEGESDAVLAAADVAVTASGTATVQTALHGVPMVVVYRVAPLEYTIGRRFVKLDMFAMVNLIAGRRIVPELIQDALTAPAVAAEVVSMIRDPARAQSIKQDLSEVRQRLGTPGASRRAAEAILHLVEGSCASSV